MIKLKVNQLKLFLDKAAVIEDNSIVPITKYVKLECEGDVATMTKTSLSAFVVHNIQEVEFKKNCTVLLEEKSLRTAVQFATGDTLEITIKETTSKDGTTTLQVVTLDDSVDVQIKFQTEPVALFPSIPEYDKEQSYELKPEMIESMYLASGATQPIKSGIVLPINYVFLKGLPETEAAGKKKKPSRRFFICGYNGSIMSWKTFEGDTPDMALEPNVCKALSKYQELGLTMYRSERYDFFSAGTTLFGFVKPEVKPMPFEQIVAMMDPDKSFTVNRKAIVKFCNVALGVTTTGLFEPAYFEGHKKETLVTFNSEGDAGLHGNRADLEIVKNRKHDIERFHFNAKEMISLLKDLPYETIRMTGLCKTNFYVTSDEDKDFVGVIVRINVNAVVNTKGGGNE